MDLKLYEKRTFSFSKEPYEIQEILDEPNIYMSWTWTTSICPYCKKKIERTTQHKFYKIEILVRCELVNGEYKAKETVTEDDVVITGFTLDNRYMQIPRDVNAYKETLSKSEKFKYLLKQK